MFKRFSFSTLLRLAAVVLPLAIASASAHAQQSIVYVDANSTNTTAPSTSNPGNSWATAYKYLQNALTRTDQIFGEPTPPSNIQIWVRGSSTGLTYYPDEGAGLTNNDQALEFSLRNSVGIYGGFAGSESNLNDRNYATNVTILSGDIDGDGLDADNSHHVVRANGVNASAILDGFTINMGFADSASGNGNVGAGMIILGSPGIPVVLRCRFTNNKASSAGGAVFIQSAQNADPEFRNCRFDLNEAASHGGAVEIDDNGGSGSDPDFYDCLFHDNTTAVGGSAIHADAGCSATVNNCTIVQNLNTISGGGALAHNNSEPACADPPPTRNGSFFINNTIIYDNIIDTISDPPARNAPGATHRRCVSCLLRGRRPRRALQLLVSREQHVRRSGFRQSRQQRFPHRMQFIRSQQRQ